jgi:putative hydrolase of the HAD superfamily
VKAVIFDVDGVLIKSKDVLGEYLWNKNIEKDLGLTADHMRLMYTADWSLVLKGLLDVRQYFKTRFDALNIALSVDVFIEYWLRCDSIVDSEVIQVLEAIKGPKLYIGTNQERRRTLFIREKFKSYFDGIFSSYQVGAIKPEPEFYRYIESNLKIQAKDIAFIDDSKSHIEAAVRLGWTCHHYRNIKDLNDFVQKL